MKTNVLYFSTVMLVALSAVSIASAWTTPTPLSGVNSPYSDSWVTVSNDKLTLYFGRSGIPGQYFNQMYMATRQSAADSFGNVTKISELAYSGGHVNNSWISPDNLHIYFSRTEPDGVSGTWRMKESTRATTSSPWGTPQNLVELNNIGQTGFPKLSADELSIVFDVFPYGSQTGSLYTASRSSISSPFSNIQAVTSLNTSDVRAQFLSADGLTLYFARNDSGVYHNYMTSRSSLASTFGTPQQLNYWPQGYGLGCFSADGQTAYLGYNGDIYVSQIPEPATLVLLGLGGIFLRRKAKSA